MQIKIKFSKPFIWFCIIAGIIILLLSFYFVKNYYVDYREKQFNYKIESYIANHPDLFAKKETPAPESIPKEDIPSDDTKWIGEKIKEYPENLEYLIKNPKPEKVNYINGGINNPDLSPEEIVQQNLPASVMVYTDAWEDGFSYGTGVIIDSKGIVASSYHIFGDTEDPTLINCKRGAIILSDNKTIYPITSVLYVDAEKDLIVLKIDGKNKKFPTVKLGNSELIKPGQKVVSIGNSIGFLYTVLDGLISGFKKNTTTKFIQFSNLIEGGNSGGGLFNSQGQAIGIVNSGMSYTYGINFATPTNYLKNLLDKK